jgi:hypothetical protein
MQKMEQKNKRIFAISGNISSEASEEIFKLVGEKEKILYEAKKIVETEEKEPLNLFQKFENIYYIYKDKENTILQLFVCDVED